MRFFPCLWSMGHDVTVSNIWWVLECETLCVCMWIDKQGCSALPCPAFRNIIKTDCTISTKHEINKYPFRFVSCCISIKCHAIVHNSLKRKCPVCRGKCNCNNWTFCHNQNCIVTRLRSNWMQTYSLWHRIAKCFGSIFFSSLWFICLFGMFLTITGIDLYFQSHLLVLDLEFDFYASNAPVSNML